MSNSNLYFTDEELDRICAHFNRMAGYGENDYGRWVRYGSSVLEEHYTWCPYVKIRDLELVWAQLSA